MSLSLTPYIVDTQELIEVIERKKKDYSLFDPAVWRKVNQKIKDSEFSGITGKMIYEDMISKNYRFPAPVYSFGFEAMMQRSMQNFRIEYNRKRRYNLLVSEGVKPDSIQYLLHNSVNGLNIASANTFAGKVIDENKNPIPGAMVETNDKGTAVITDLNGNFSLQKNDSLLHVQATAVGYRNKNVLLKPHEANLITIEQNQNALNDAVVTGDGIKRNKLNNVNRFKTCFINR